MTRFTRTLALAAIGVGAAAAAAKAKADVSIDIGAVPDCPYGQYDTAPNSCAPYGYYGPEQFSGGVFIGVGPWFHGPAHFNGHMDNRFDVHHGYGGPLPQHGEHADPANHLDHIHHFRGNEIRDDRGHVGGGRRQGPGGAPAAGADVHGAWAPCAPGHLVWHRAAEMMK